MVIVNRVLTNFVRLKRVYRKDMYASFIHSVYNESSLFDTVFLSCNDLHTKGFKYTFFLSWKRGIHSARRTMLRARCLYNGRSRAVSATYMMSRFAFKKFASSGSLNGIRKASW